MSTSDVLASVRLLTRKQVAEILVCSVRTVIRLQDDGDLPVVRIGPGLLRYRLSDVEALLELRVKGQVVS